MAKKLMFDYPGDEEFFEELLVKFGGLKQNYDLFDFRAPDIKRREFSKVRNKVFQSLMDLYGDVCQLKCHNDCAGRAEHVDHIIPLATNELNKKLRYMKGVDGKKAIAQSFGSNKQINFALACARCNSYKKHKLPSVEILQQTLGV